MSFCVTHYGAILGSIYLAVFLICLWHWPPCEPIPLGVQCNLFSTLIILALLTYILKLHIKVLNFQPNVLNIVGTLIVLTLLDDLYFYLCHRLMHKPLLKKYVHAVHHARKPPRAMDMFVSHPVEYLIMASGYGIIIAGMFLVFGWKMSAWGVFLAILLRLVHEMSVHEGAPDALRIRWCFPFQTAEHHLNHHSGYHSGTYGNYSSMLQIWDNVFKTNMLQQ
jgi:lathosterol oxidase